MNGGGGVEEVDVVVVTSLFGLWMFGFWPSPNRKSSFKTPFKSLNSNVGT